MYVVANKSIKKYGESNEDDEKKWNRKEDL